MLDWLKGLGKGTDHPMASADKARDLIAELPREDPARFLEEIASWLDSVADTDGFRPADRWRAVRLLDEAGRPVEIVLLREYLGITEFRDYHATHLWQAVHEFCAARARAYLRCVAELEPGKAAAALGEDLPPLFVRALRAAGERMKVSLMRYLPVEAETWQELYRGHAAAQAHDLLHGAALGYMGDTLRSTPEQELLRALMLAVAAPESMAPEEIEIAWRCGARYASAFEISGDAADARPFAFDPASAGPPQRAQGAGGGALLHFGAAQVLPKLDEAINRSEDDLDPENRLGKEYTPMQKLAVLRHLHRHWGPLAPSQRERRIPLSGEIQVVHGYRAVAKTVTRIEYATDAELSDDLSLRESQATAGLAIEKDGDRPAPEAWNAVAASTGGLEAVVPAGRGGWMHIGQLLAVQSPVAEAWTAGVLKSLYTDADNHLHARIELLSPKPVCVFLRALGKGETMASNWETASGSFSYDYVEAILLPDASGSLQSAGMVLPSGTFTPGHVLELMLGEGTRHVELTALLEQGRDYEKVAFAWKSAGQA